MKKIFYYGTFKTFYNYLTLNCWYVIQRILQAGLLGIISFFMKEKVHFIVKILAH